MRLSLTTLLETLIHRAGVRFTGVCSLSGVALLSAFMLAGCATPETTIVRSANRAPLQEMDVIIDKDQISRAFSDYKGSLLYGTKKMDSSVFLGAFARAVRDQATTAKVNAAIQVESLQFLQSGLPSSPGLPSTGKPLLILRASAYTRLEDRSIKSDLGWRGATNWEFILLERTGNSRYSTTWQATVAGENLSPVVCGDYAGCSAALAEKVFSQLRKDKVVR